MPPGRKAQRWFWHSPRRQCVPTQIALKWMQEGDCSGAGTPMSAAARQCRGTPKKKNMKPQQTTARPPVDLDATDEYPVLDATAYEA